MRYKLIAFDLDGTLITRGGKISPANLRALHDAREAGALVVPCTGRAWQEARSVMVQIDSMAHDTAGVFVTGAAVCDVHTGKVLDNAGIDPDLSLEIVDHLSDHPDAVLVFQNSQAVGRDYIVAGRGELTANTQWWFAHNKLTSVRIPSPTADDLLHTLRIGVVTPAPIAKALVKNVQRRWGESVVAHSFSAIHLPDMSEAPHILEIFAQGIDKWHGIEVLAKMHGIDHADVAVIGDEVNDLSMLTHAGCPIAMGNAIPEAKRLAKYITDPVDDDGVAGAIRRLLSGEWA